MSDKPVSSDPGMAEEARKESGALLEALRGKDGVERQRARKRLTELGHAAVPSLIQMLDHENAQARWESAKALVEIGDPTSASALVGALEDENMDVRWVAAEGLIVLGEEGLRPLFEALVRKSKSTWMREGAHHVLHDLRNGPAADVIAPVLNALEPSAPNMEVAAAAHSALHSLRRKSQ